MTANYEFKTLGELFDHFKAFGVTAEDIQAALEERGRFDVARRTMAKALREDEGLRIGYVANVAMLLHDRYGITDHETRNEAAEAILRKIFEEY